jgi:hypothetical protein
MLQALTDGLQLQWLVDPDFDMGSLIEALFELARPADDHVRGRG